MEAGDRLVREQMGRRNKIHCKWELRLVPAVTRKCLAKSSPSLLLVSLTYRQPLGAPSNLSSAQASNSSCPLCLHVSV